MADLSQIKVGNVIYDIKDSVARENAGKGGADLDFKNCYLHVFEYYLNASPSVTFYIYIPMSTKELQGGNYLKKESIQCDYWDVYGLIYPGAFVASSHGVYDGNNTNYLHTDLVVMEEAFDEENYTGMYKLGVNINGGFMPLDLLTFVGEKVI